jgi:hypothetical protein
MTRAEKEALERPSNGKRVYVYDPALERCVEKEPEPARGPLPQMYMRKFTGAADFTNFGMSKWR